MYDALDVCDCIFEVMCENCNKGYDECHGEEEYNYRQMVICIGELLQIKRGD
jgi:hypothetical protein